MKVELIYDEHCPNVKAARECLLQAFAATNVPASWREWNRSSPHAPAYAKNFGSPTILVNGQDVTGNNARSDGNSCRVYKSASGGFSGTPSVWQISTALLSPRHRARWGSVVSAVPGIGIAILPKLTCAACWPAYAGVFSAMGVGFFNYTEYLAPIMATALLIALAALFFKAKERRGFGPFLVGVVASAVIWLGKFSLDSGMLLYGGTALLLAASLWNSWPRKMACVSCQPITIEG